MKLKNKISGEIKEFSLFDGNVLQGGATLKSLTDEWEDYEEPKEWWAIDQFGEPINVTGLSSLQLEKLRRIGNLFESEEKTEEAVEKLRAWKRLRDIGCRFILDDSFAVKFVGPEVKKIVSAEEGRILCDSYRLLFGGEK